LCFVPAAFPRLQIKFYFDGSEICM
jgi:hypothetical protein